MEGEDPVKGFQTTADYERQKVEASAKALLAKAEALRLDFSKGELHANAITPKHFGNTHYSSLQAENETLPWTEKVEIVLSPGSSASSSTNGNFKIVLRGLIKFPGGWRSYDGVQWESFPGDVADQKTRLELAALSRIASHQGLNGEVDPALLKLGETLVRFIRERDAGIYEKEVCITGDLIWVQFQRSGQKGPTRQELDKELSVRMREQVDLARATLKQMEDAGIDLKNAEIQIVDAAVEQCQSRAPGSLDGLAGSQFKLKLAVKTAGKSKNGTSLSGDYILAANQIMRFENDWKVMDGLHWQQLPEGVLDQEAVAKMRFENYVAQYRTLPPMMAAPEIEFISLNGEKKMKLSDLKGKVVVLDFWATWCGPCQEPMADLQKIRAGHPDWKDNVAIVPLSIDDTLDAVRKHVDKRSWTNTFNVWADDGGWRSKPATTFRVSSVPTTYIIDAEGKIVAAGHPVGLRIAETVDGLLKSRSK